MVNFEQVVKERRSANNFLPAHSITRKELNEIFELVKFGPSAYNLQHTNYIVVMDQKLKELLKKAAYGQNKVKTASAVLIVLGDKKAYQQAPELYEGLLRLGFLSKPEYEIMVNETISYYESRDEVFRKEDAIKNASLSAMLFMLAAKAKGWDTCPMTGHDPIAIREILNIDERYEVVMMIAIGKEDMSTRGPRGYRKPVGEFVKYI